MSELSECRGWRSLADLFGAESAAPVGFIGAPQAEKSLTPGRCDLAPGKLRETARRFSTYDVTTSADIGAIRIRDYGDLALKTLTPVDSFAPIREAVASAAAKHEFVILCGGNNAVTRPGVHGLGGDLGSTGLLTLDAHFDLRDTDCGLTNGNPVKALLEDGLPGRNIVQIGLAPFANTKRMHETALAAGIDVVTLADERPLAQIVSEKLDALAARCGRVYVDFDIDVIDRAQCPGAPGARPGGVSAQAFFAAARAAGAHPAVKAVDLTEFDPSLDVSDITALAAGRWLAEIVSGFASRNRKP